jgi:prepilin-type N-terminal cleavage/methylation domain-containing protein
MLNNRLLSHTAGRTSRGGFTLVELLVVIGIIAILAGVALGPITNGIKKAQQSAGLQNARTIGLSEFQYSNDNNSIYPDGVDAGAVAQLLITGKYVTDPKLFVISGDNRAAPYVPGANVPLTASNVSYDFAGVNGTATGAGQPSQVGVNSNAPDQLPIVWSGGESAAAAGLPGAQANAGVSFKPTGGGPYGLAGIAVAYKSNSAAFLRPQPGPSPQFPGQGMIGFVDQTFDPAGTQYQARIGDYQ